MMNYEMKSRRQAEKLKTQDTVRILSLETSCDFVHAAALLGAAANMRVEPSVCVQETEGIAGSGRMTLRALVLLGAEAFETAEREVVTGAQDGEAGNLLMKQQKAESCIHELAGEEKTLVREEFDLPAKLGVGDVLSASAIAGECELSGGNGRIGVSGKVEVRVLHRPAEAGNALVTTVHEIPFELGIDAKMHDGEQIRPSAEVIDVMADSIESDKSRTLRLEAQVRVRLMRMRQESREVISDLYSLSGPELEPVTEMIDLHTCQQHMCSRESTRLQVMLPEGAPPIGTMLAAFARPTIAAATPAGRRLDAEGVMQVTLIYLPLDSDIPYAVHTREPFAMTFPVEVGEGVSAQAYVIETMIGPTTSDRAELRCVLGLQAVQHGVQRMRVVTDVEQKPEQKMERGFVLVWPAAGETRWDTARRLRVREESLRPAGKHALLALRR